MARPEFKCQVAVQFLAEQSTPQSGAFAFAYTITITNTGDVTAQLIARHWVITDAKGHVQKVSGLAVVGQQPLLKPGERFEYTSWTRIATPQGPMKGTYLCITEDAVPFETTIPEFMLAVPSALH
jgi:ApaG protein